jgi:hypothetical protein
MPGSQTVAGENWTPRQDGLFEKQKQKKTVMDADREGKYFSSSWRAMPVLRVVKSVDVGGGVFS